jgi:hypothetical protein
MMSAPLKAEAILTSAIPSSAEPNRLSFPRRQHRVRAAIHEPRVARAVFGIRDS